MAAGNGFIQEIQRRHVVRAAIAYVVSAWLVVQVADVLLPVFGAPEIIIQWLMVALAIGLPGALIFSWFYEITADGIKRTKDVALDDAEYKLFGRRVDFVIIGILTAALTMSIYGNVRGPGVAPESLSILIADFENETGNELFSGVLEESLRVGLEVAPFVNSFPRAAAASIAAKIPGHESTVLDIETAGLIALREGINIVVAGSIRRNGDELEVFVQAIAPGDQQELFAITESAGSDLEILTAIAEIAKDLRLELGDTEKPGDAGENESFAVGNLQAASEYLDAQELQRNSKNEEAVVHYENALELDPNFARAYAGLALTKQYLGDADAATANWDEALERLDTLTERGRLRTLGLYFMSNQNDFVNALKTFESLVEKYPADNTAQNNLAVTAFYAMDFDRALEVGREVAARFPDDSGYGGNYALYAMYASRFDEAAEIAQKVIDIDPVNAYAHFVTALAFAVSGDTKAAEATFTKMTELDQFGRSVGQEGLADLALYRGDAAASVEILDAAIQEEIALNANHNVALKQIIRAQALLQLEDPGLAREAIDAALNHSGGDVAILVPAAMTLITLGDEERMEAAVEELLGSFSATHEAYADAVQAYAALQRGDLESATSLANTAIASADLWFVRFIRAQIHLESGRTNESLADIEVCRNRIGEGIAVFLNDRPSFRLKRDFDELAAAATAALAD